MLTRVQLAAEFIRLPLSFDAEVMRSEIAAIPESAWRPHPQGHPGNSALPLISRHGDPADDGVAGPMLPTCHLDACEYLRQVIESFETVVGRSRLMRLEGGAQATSHVDVNYYWAERVRIHVPILTSPAIEFLCGDSRLHMAAGEAWIFDTSRLHNVLNPTSERRVHLVADTVGSAAFWDLVARSTDEPRPVRHRPGAPATLQTERVNVPVVMSPWEQRQLIDGLLAGARHPELEAVLDALARDWRSTWARFGDAREGWPVYQQLVDDADAALAPLAGRVPLPNGLDAAQLARQVVLDTAVNPALAAAPPGRATGRRRPRLTRPLIIVAPPRSGSTLLFETLAASPDLWTIGGESHAVIEGIGGLAPADRGWDSNRLTAIDATPPVVEALHDRFLGELRDRDGAPATEAGAVRLLEKTPKNSLRVGFLDAVFPDALFVYLHREPGPTIASIVEAWASGRFTTYPHLPGWPGRPWSLALTPEWRALAGRPLAEVAAAQWQATVSAALDELERLDPARWIGLDYDALVADPQAQVGRICAFAELRWDRELQAGLPLSRNTLTPPDPDKWLAHEPELAPLLAELQPLAERSRAAVAHDPGAPSLPRSPASRLRSVSTTSLPELLTELGSSVLVSTYQTGNVVALRAHETALNTHFRALESPMGIAVSGDRLAIGTAGAIVEYRDVPAVGARLAPELGPVDACYVPRRVHTTGDVRVHDVAYAGDELWLVATSFSCLATLDDYHSFVPRWLPPFVDVLDGQDRCHLNGMAVVDDEVRWVTALGASGAPGGWREERASGGVLIDVASGEVAIAGLSMPHSPRFHDGRLWLLESGEGTLALADPAAGTVETVAHLPGFTRGLAFAGPLAFVGLSQVREAATFGGLPLTGRLEDRSSGVWVVDLRSGEIVAFVRFEGAVQEIFDVAVLPGRRFPELAEPSSAAARLSFVVPALT